MDLMLKDKVVIVTGAGRHIGREIALTFAREGAKVGVNDFFEDRAMGVASEVQVLGQEALALKADVTDSEAVKAMVDKVIKQWGRIDILVNNAGIAPKEAGFVQTGTPFLEMAWGDWNPTIYVNLFGTIHCTKAVLPWMVNQKYGKIINIMSDAGRVGEPRLVAYSAAKAALGGFTKALAKEVGRHCINVNCVSIGATPGAHKVSEYSAEEWERRKQAISKLYPLAAGLNRLGTPEDVANMVAFLASDKAAWVTGQIISVNGGYATVG